MRAALKIVSVWGAQRSPGGPSSPGALASAILLEDGVSGLQLQDNFDFLLETGDSAGGAIALESGSGILLETESFILLERGR